LADGFRCELVSWPAVESWVDAIVAKMAGDGFAPDIVIGMLRGGMVPARLICDHLVVKNLFTVKTEHWGLTATKDGKAKLAQSLTVDVAGKKVLVVDDITDTGQSLTLARDHVRALAPSALKTATLLHIEHSLIAPDYFARAVSKEQWTWFVFPWNVREDLRNIVPKALDDALTYPELKARLAAAFHIEPGDGLLKEALAACERDGSVKAKGRKWAAAAK
jgi:hypoxanthine phosphoribosyltransferase